MWTSLTHAFKAAFNLLLPPVCLLCDQRLPDSQDNINLCPDCLGETRSISPGHCSCCSRIFHSSASNHLCGTCIDRPPAFSSVYAVGAYSGSIKSAIHKLKYRNQLSLAPSLGKLITDTLTEQTGTFTPDCIIPVPLHVSRLRRRGYNQALEIARPVAKRLKAPLEPMLLRRERNTPQQQGLTAKERQKNLRNAFTLTRPTAARRVLLVDDVMTTGETLRECSRVLIDGGIEEVRVAVLGRA